MEFKEHLLGILSYFSNLFLAIATIKMKDMDLLLAIFLKIFTIMSTIAITLYYIAKLKNEKRKDDDTKKDIKSSESSGSD